jgi:short chain dehydrogenase
MTRLPASHTNGQENGRAGSVDPGHLLLVGAGPGLGLAIAHRFAIGGYRVTLVARTTDRLGELARNLDDTSAEINTVEADASSPEDLRARMVELYHEEGADSRDPQRRPGLARSANELDRGPSAGGLRRRRHWRHSRGPGSRSRDEGSRTRDDDRHRRGLRRPPGTGPRDCLARQSCPPVGCNDARCRPGPGWHPGRNSHDRRTDRRGHGI